MRNRGPDPFHGRQESCGRRRRADNPTRTFRAGQARRSGGRAGTGQGAAAGGPKLSSGDLELGEHEGA